MADIPREQIWCSQLLNVQRLVGSSRDRMRSYDNEADMATEWLHSLCTEQNFDINMTIEKYILKLKLHNDAFGYNSKQT